jgi:hypothetical protein
MVVIGFAIPMLMILAAATSVAADTVYLSREEALRRALPGADRIVTNRVAWSDAQRLVLGKAHGLKLRASADVLCGYAGTNLLGYALFADEIGKHEPITFVVAIRPDGAIEGIEVAVYREHIGAGVRHPGFLGQFQGKRLGDPMRPGRDVDGVSGATLSCRAAERAAKTSLIAVKALREGPP